MISTWGATGGLKPAMNLNLLSGAISSLVTFTRATTATVTDFEGLIKNTKSGEVRFDGMRRVENLLSNTETLSTQSVTVLAGTHVFTLGSASTGSVTFSGAATGTLSGNGVDRKYITLTTTAASLTITVTGSVKQAQLENVTGQSNQNPSEYVSKGVLSAPYQGANVDGVQYFPYTNPNCIINGAITQIPSIAINSSNSKWAYKCTASGDYFSTPSSAANQITGNLSLLVQVALDDWTPTTVQTLVAKDGVTAGLRSWVFNIQTSGAPRLNYSLDGTNIISVTASASTGFTDRTTHFIGVQREASTGIVKFYTSEDGRTFTQLGTDQTGTAGSLYNASTQPVQFGNLSSLSFALDGRIYDSHIYSGLKFTGTSTMVVDFDPSNWTSGSTFTGLETGEVWTLNGNAKIYQGLWDAVGPKSMLIEEQRTNLLTYSQDFSNAAWTKDGVTISANIISAPDNSTTATLVTPTTALALHAILQSPLYTGTYTASIYVKPNGYTNFSIVNGAQAIGVDFSGIGTTNTISNFGSGTGTITPSINGWYLLTATLPNLSAATIRFFVNSRANYTGDGTSGVYVWGAQLEAGSFATSYIPTVASQVTRAADQASMTGTNFSSWYNQSAGSFYVDADCAKDNSVIIDASNNATSNRNTITRASSTSFTDQVTSGSSSQATMTPTTVNWANMNKVMVGYAANDFAAVGNGGAVSTDTNGSVPVSLSQLNIGGDYAATAALYLNGHIRTIRYYNQRLPNTTLQSLTA